MVDSGCDEWAVAGSFVMIICDCQALDTNHFDVWEY